MKRLISFPAPIVTLFLSFFFVISIFQSSTLAKEQDDDFLLLFMPAILAAHQSTQYDPNNPHASIRSWKGTATCLKCHSQEGEEVFHSTHYQWLGETPYMTNGPDIQGKLDMGVNSYCINTTGNWNGCGACHAGLGARPEPTISSSQLTNIDCLICHQDQYKRKKVDGIFVPDSAAMTITMKEAAQTVHLPTREGCLQCHAKGGGGDNYKRGDMALAHANTTDRSFDIHMARTGANLTCQSCHKTEDHLMAGKGSDLRPTDLDVEMSCTDCHTGKDTTEGHGNRTVGRHVARVACQSCHIPVYAKNAADTLATEETETHRDWQQPHLTASGAIHPTPTMAGNLNPRYKWWNGSSSSYLLYDQVASPIPATIPTSEPNGSVSNDGSKLYPFKYKTAFQPLNSYTNELIALDTSIYFSTGHYEDATRAGLINMGRDPNDLVTWVTTDTYQLITHEVAPATSGLQCLDCHDNTSRMDLTGELGYALKGSRSQVCTQCHGLEDDKDDKMYLWIHKEHVEGENIDCSLCHTFTRPERGLSTAIVHDD
ncbi:MAG: hypothetical protein ACI8ZB_001340 [Desulforhopalus sp.]|jgi:hypothetical protein